MVSCDVSASSAYHAIATKSRYITFIYAITLLVFRINYEALLYLYVSY